jgi:hypothetical protein
MSLDGGRDHLAGLLKTLLSYWDHASPYWQDTMKVQFLDQVLTPLEEQTAVALQAIDRMDVILRQMRRDCEGSHFDIFGSD